MRSHLPEKSVVIVAAKRTPQGSFQGQFSTVSASGLGAHAIRSAVESVSLDVEHIDALHFGCVLPAGQGQAPARQAGLKAGLTLATPCTTVNKMCGSGMQAAIYAYNQIVANDANCIVAGGMESMTNAPHLLPKARQGYRLGDSTVIDHMFYDGLRDVKHGELMGVFAELCADSYHFSREEQDTFAIRSVTLAKAAIKSNAFSAEVAPVLVKTRHGETLYTEDEQPFKSDIEKIPSLRPAFKKNGTVTAANSSSISDGAAALILMDSEEAKKQGIAPLAKMVAHASHAQDADWFSTAPIFAIKKLLKKCDWAIDDVDLFEINEAFAVVTMVAIKELSLNPDKVNVNGGACALGHPIGSSGARIIVSLIHALQARGLKRGIASLCIGGGEATAVAIECP